MIKTRKWPHARLAACASRYFPPFTSSLFGFIPVKFPVHSTDRFVQLPANAGLYEDEDYFGERRLAGVNPVMLRSLVSDDPRAAIIANMPGASAAIAAGTAPLQHAT